MEALKTRRVTKPVVAWVSGTCAKLFKSEVQFGHAGAKSGGDEGGCCETRGKEWGAGCRGGGWAGGWQIGRAHV